MGQADASKNGPDAHKNLADVSHLNISVYACMYVQQSFNMDANNHESYDVEAMTCDAV